MNKLQKQMAIDIETEYNIKLRLNKKSNRINQCRRTFRMERFILFAHIKLIKSILVLLHNL